MKQLLNTLFVTTQGSYLSKEGDTVLVHQEQEVKLRVPIHNLGSIVCFGNVLCSPFLLGLCGERNVTISFLTENGRFLARVYGPVSGNVLLRREQYRRADDPATSAESPGPWSPPKSPTAGSSCKGRCGMGRNWRIPPR